MLYNIFEYGIEEVFCMNSQFRNSSFGFLLYLFIIVLISIATIFIIWYMTVGYKLGTYGPETRLGSVYIGGLREDEVLPRFEEKRDVWYSDETIVFELQYQGYRYEFDRDLFFFDSEASLYYLIDGQTNNVVVYYQGSDKQTVLDEIEALPFMQDIKDNVDLGELINSILYDASLMKSYSSKDIEDFLIDESLSIQELGTTTFAIPEGVEMDHFLEAIETVFEDGKIIAPSKDLFDVLTIFQNEMYDAEMTILSGAILDLILETNFIINEVHYQPNIDFTVYTIDTYPFFARNATTNAVVNESFSFYNPNESDYYFTVEATDSFNGVVRFYGIPFMYDIEVTIDHVELDYITQSTRDVTLLQQGQEGVIINVVRTITNIYEVVVFDEEILFEFYPPVKEIIFEP